MRIKTTYVKRFVIVLSLCLVPQVVSAQFFSDTNHPELVWTDIETEHFKITYHTGLDDFAQRVARIAEEVYGPITDLYDFKPKAKPRILCRDIDDTNRSAFYPTTNTIDFFVGA